MRHVLLLAITQAVLTVGPASGQAVIGRVSEEASRRPLTGAEVRLLSETGEVVARTLSDSAGRYDLGLPASGNYRVAADLFGYQRLESPLAALSMERSVSIDFELPADPIELDEVRVAVERREELVRRATQYGVIPDNLGERFVSVEAIDRRETARDFGQVLQWQSIPGLSVLRGEDVGAGPSVCVRVGSRRSQAECALMVLDGQIVDMEVAGQFPPEALGGIIVLTPLEAATTFGTAGGSGAVLLFSKSALLNRR